MAFEITHQHQWCTSNKLQLFYCNKTEKGKDFKIPLKGNPMSEENVKPQLNSSEELMKVQLKEETVR